MDAGARSHAQSKWNEAICGELLAKADSQVDGGLEIFTV